jgi:hypothetical protein
MPPELEGAAAVFPQGLIRKDGSIESGCLFIDGKGALQRFVWLYELNVDEKEVQGAVSTAVRNQDCRDLELEDKKFQPWASRDMRFVVDLCSEQVDRIVQSNPWWAKLEFQLRYEQGRLAGFRTYLGVF